MTTQQTESVGQSSGPGHKRRIQKKKTRERILQAAIQRFGQDGILLARTVDIARDAKVAHGSVFAHFSSRQVLVTESISLFAETVTRRLHDLAEEQAGFGQLLLAHLQGLAENESFYRRLVAEGPQLDPEARATLVGIQSAISFHLSLALDTEMASGSIRRLPVAMVFNTWLGLVHHYLLNPDLFAPGKSSVLEHCRHTLVAFLMALLAVKPKESSTTSTPTTAEE